MDKEEFRHLMTQKLSGSLEEPQTTKLFEYLEDHPDEKKIFEEFKARWELSGDMVLAQESSVEASWQAFVELKKGKAKSVSMWQILSKYAAIVLISVGLGFLFKEMAKSQPTNYLTLEGETRTVVLSDSSLVFLNESSLIAVSADYGVDERAVELEGEAFFEITKDQDRPFVVETGGTTTTVLGTAFNLNAVGGEVALVVVSGKVSFDTEDQRQLVLTKGMAANFVPETGKLAMMEPESNLMAWHSKTFQYDNESITNVLSQLSNYFKVDIKTSNPKINQCRFTGDFNQPTLVQVIKVLSVTLDLSVTKTKDQYLLDGPGCN